RMDRGARLGVNQGEAEGVDFRPRLKLSPQICPQDCPRGAAAGRFLWDSCNKNETIPGSLTPEGGDFMPPLIFL
ncbi:MAG: hypothetical protein IJY46_10810, partial [Lentisphaeria bacterium]|nr:hypothetical protein [Lentisphaeria bacterium]